MFKHLINKNVSIHKTRIKMTKQKLLELFEVATDLLEFDIANPYLIIVFTAVLMIVNLFILHKLSHLWHVERLENGLVATLYFITEAVNFIIAFIFLDILIKGYSKSKIQIKYIIAFFMTAANPLLICLLFY